MPTTKTKTTNRKAAKTTKKTKRPPRKSAPKIITDRLDALKSSLDNLGTNVFLADRDLNLIYINKRGMNTLRSIEQTIREAFGVGVDQLVGMNLDEFHKSRAAEIRARLSNPGGLPIRADIQLGNLILDLNVNGVFDPNGEYLGQVVNWEEISAKKQAEANQARMQAMLENAPTNIILADKDLNITYVNPATVKNLTPLAHLLPVPIDKIVGSNIDVFHKNPSYQRGILADPNNLPRQAVIEIGDQKLDLLVTAITDQDGEYIGPMVTWENVTEKLHLEERTKQMTEEARQKEEELQAKVQELLVTVNAAADGDLTVPITVSGEDAVGQLAGALASMIERIKDLIGQITESVEQVGEAARQISASSQQLAEGASEQASSIEETSSALEEMTAMVRTNAENANNANELSGTARGAAVDGSGIMDRLQNTMKGITDASEKISKIIKVIEEIAFQTNLLALNAAVEAARAGEHGKGFAVVAEEVRNLAQRSAQAAKDTTDLIENSVTQAKQGTTVTLDAAQSLQSIVDNISKVAELISGINTASNEQSQGIEQINTAVSQMDKVTQQNSAGAEESASAAEQMNAQMVSLKEMCEQFKVSNDDQPRSAGARRQDHSSNRSTQPTGSLQPSRGGNGNRVRKNQDTPSKGKPVVVSAAKSGNRDEAAEEFMSLNDDSIKEF